MSKVDTKQVITHDEVAQSYVDLIQFAANVEPDYRYECGLMVAHYIFHSRHADPYLDCVEPREFFESYGVDFCGDWDFAPSEFSMIKDLIDKLFNPMAVTDCGMFFHEVRGHEEHTSGEIDVYTAKSWNEIYQICQNRADSIPENALEYRFVAAKIEQFQQNKKDRKLAA